MECEKMVLTMLRIWGILDPCVGSIRQANPRGCALLPCPFCTALRVRRGKHRRENQLGSNEFITSVIHCGRRIMISENDRWLLNCQETARLLGISTRHLWNLTYPRGPIPCVRIGHLVRYRCEDLQAYLEREVRKPEEKMDNNKNPHSREEE